MDKITLIKDTKPSRKAFNNFRDIVHHKFEAALRMIELGKLFKENRDQKMYKQFGCKSFTEFLAMPEIGFQRSTVYAFIHIHELYVDKLGREPIELCNIGMYKLQQINPVVEGDPDEWLSKAEVLSPKDLINCVREHQGKEPMPEPPQVAHGHSNCILHPDRESVQAHFPITIKAGGKFTIPLCPECHDELHHMGVDSWFSVYKRPLGVYLETLI